VKHPHIRYRVKFNAQLRKYVVIDRTTGDFVADNYYREKAEREAERLNRLHQDNTGEEVPE
jgi:hypothetical protein